MLNELLRDADPLRLEPRRPSEERDRYRRAVIAAATDAAPAAWPSRGRMALLIAIGAIVITALTVGSQIVSQRDAVLQAAVRFEVRLAEEAPSPGLQQARIAGSDRVVYLHREIIVNNDDIAKSRVVQGDGPARFGVSVELTPEAARKALQATANHIGKPVAVLIDGAVVTAPIVRSPIGASGLISGDYTRSEAERIVNGIGVR
jgi:preprotein translocase subunit SecD